MLTIICRPLSANRLGRNRIYKLVRELDPEGLAVRRKKAQQHRGAVIFEGPNEVWSMDAYCKLEHWGIQIYAAIDGYSRHVMWYYVGITGRTAVSVLGQYLLAINATGVVPRKLRTDRGAETPMVADAHYTISNEIREPEDGLRTFLSFGETFKYGTSKQNSVVERWWRQGSYGVILQWRDCFLEYNRTKQFDSDLIADRVAFLFIYMPIIRYALTEFVHVWNHHKIRKQPNRPHVVSGIPHNLYYRPHRTGGIDCGTSYPKDSPTIEAISNDLQGLDIDEYLPAQIMEWCSNALLRLGFTGEINGARTTDTGERIHRLSFIALRDEARLHVATGQAPALYESEKPWNARRWSADYRPSDLIQRVYSDANEELVVGGSEEQLHGTIYEEQQDLDPALRREMDAFASGAI